MTPRIVSLVPSLTELICALGLGDYLVGRTGFCVHPRAQLAAVPKVGGTKTVNIERIRALRPTHLLVSREENEQPTVAKLAEFIPEILVADAHTLSENRHLYDRFGETFAVQAAAGQLRDAFDERVLRIASHRHQAVPVLYLIWKSPWMSVTRNTFISSMLASVGLHTVPAREGVSDADRYPVIEDADFFTLQPEVVLLSSEPFRFEAEHCAEVSAMIATQRRSVPAQTLPPVCALIDGEMTSWFGVRAIAGLDYLADFRTRLDQRLQVAS